MKHMIFMIVLTLFSGTSLANKEADYLIEGCKQLANMYNNRSDLNLLNSITLSPSDTLMAGYCRGVIESFVYFVPAYKLCSSSDWYNIANKIALKNSRSDMNNDGYFDIKDIIISGCQ